MCIKIYSFFTAVITETIVGTSVNYVSAYIIMVCNVIAMYIKLYNIVCF